MSKILDVQKIYFESYRDSRGILTSVEGDQDVPFEIKRVFYLHHIISDRGGHAHMDTDQVIISLHGEFELEISDRKSTIKFILNDPREGIYVPRMLFVRMKNFKDNAVCFVLANTHYDMKKSIRSWEEYKSLQID